MCRCVAGVVSTSWSICAMRRSRRTGREASLIARWRSIKTTASRQIYNRKLYYALSLCTSIWIKKVQASKLPFFTEGSALSKHQSLKWFWYFHCSRILFPPHVVKKCSVKSSNVHKPRLHKSMLHVLCFTFYASHFQKWRCRAQVLHRSLSQCRGAAKTSHGRLRL